MKGRSCLRWFAASLLAMALLVGCAAPQQPGGQSSATSPAPAGSTQGAPAAGAGSGQEPVKVGLLIEETGQFASYGEEYLNTARIVVERINQSGGIGGRPLQAIFYNNESNPEKAIAGMQKLVQDDKVVAVVGNGLVANARAVAPQVQDRGPVYYSLSGAYTAENKYTFAASVSVPDMQSFIMDWLKQKGLTKVALLTPNDASGQVAEQALKGLIGQTGLTLVGAEAFNPNDVDVTTQLARLRDLNPDVIMCWVVGKPLGVVLKGYNQLGLDQPFVASHGNLAPALLASLAPIQPETFWIPATKDLAWRDLASSDPQYQDNQVYHNLYLEQFKKEVGLGGGTMWDALYLLKEAIEKAGTDSDAIVSYLEGVKGWTGVAGIYSFSADDHRGLGKKDAIMMQVVDGKLTIAR